jgi:glycosyltransferase involved in cell wall biosynthesis
MISVVIPARNEEKYLPKCLESLKNQDFSGDYEIIVVDNNSSDKTIAIATGYGVKVVSCSSIGVAHARQQGAMAAEGDIVVQADADTIYSTDWLTRINRHFETKAESVALAGFYVYQQPAYWANVEYFLRHKFNRLSIMMIKEPMYISGANFAFRKQLFLNAGGYQPDSLYPDQWGISHALHRFGRITYDRNLIAFTSSRRVQKPAYIILGDMARNFTGVCLYFGRRILRNRKKNNSRQED